MEALTDGRLPRVRVRRGIDEAVAVRRTPPTNAIESLNARFRKATRRRGHFPNEQAALKVLYLAIREPVSKGRSSPTGRVQGWKAALNAFAIHYGDRLFINQ